MFKVGGFEPFYLQSHHSDCQPLAADEQPLSSFTNVFVTRALLMPLFCLCLEFAATWEAEIRANGPRT